MMGPELPFAMNRYPQGLTLTVLVEVTFLPYCSLEVWLYSVPAHGQGEIPPSDSQHLDKALQNLQSLLSAAV